MPSLTQYRYFIFNVNFCFNINELCSDYIVSNNEFDILKNTENVNEYNDVLYNIQKLQFRKRERDNYYRVYLRCT